MQMMKSCVCQFIKIINLIKLTIYRSYKFGVKAKKSSLCTWSPVATASTLSQSQVCLSEITPIFTRKAMKTACLKGRSIFDPNSKPKQPHVTRLSHTLLPKGDKHHQFDTQEFSHRPDGSQLFFERLVQQHQTVHGKLERGRETDERLPDTKNIQYFVFKLHLIICRTVSNFRIKPKVTPEEHQ